MTVDSSYHKPLTMHELDSCRLAVDQAKAGSSGCQLANGADWISDIEGKTAREAIHTTAGYK